VFAVRNNKCPPDLYDLHAAATADCSLQGAFGRATPALSLSFGSSLTSVVRLNLVPAERVD
jgi:hypothetical protein